jgi:hypothetical protein
LSWLETCLFGVTVVNEPEIGTLLPSLPTASPPQL